jgi:ABC-type dipeptide/oligopeptide/nickel transport system permease component
MLLRQAVFAATVLMGAASVVFFLFAWIPADATIEILGLQSNAQARAQLAQDLGLDKPLAKRYVQYLGGLVRADLGHSLAGLGAVRPLLFERLRRTLPLILAAGGISFVAGLLLALGVAWVNQATMYRFADAVALALAAVPAFVTALALTVIFGSLGALPTMYDGSLQSAILPVVALAFAPTFWIARLISTDLRHVLSRNFILFRRALGFSDSALLFTALGNISIIGSLGTNVFLALLLGTFFIEYAFNWPGLGQLLVYSLLRRDAPVVQGVVLLFAAMILVADSSVEMARRWRAPAEC